MNVVALFCPRVIRKISSIFCISRRMCCNKVDSDRTDDAFGCFEEPLNIMWGVSDNDEHLSEYEKPIERRFSTRYNFIASSRRDALRVLDILQQDGPGFDTRAALSMLGIRVSGVLVREVLLGILKNINYANKIRAAKLGYKFFVWSAQEGNYIHTVSSYHWIMKIFSECGQFMAMWRLFEEMTEKGFPVTARTFNILLCNEAGLAKQIVEKFIKSKTFNYRPFKHSYHAILYSLLRVNQHKLIEWVFQKMLTDGHSPDILTYNILIHAKYRLGKSNQIHRLLNEMAQHGISWDVYTYSILLHVLGRNKPHAVHDIWNHMKDAGIVPNVVHFTSLIDGLSRAGNMDASQHFFNEMIKLGCFPDVACYTVMITGYIAAGNLEKARELFDGMIINGMVPNVFTYNSMIRGLCMAGRFDEACSMLKEMECRGRNPNFLVYKTLVNHLRNAGKFSDAHKIVKQMLEKGKYAHLIKRYKG